MSFLPVTLVSGIPLRVIRNSLAIQPTAAGGAFRTGYSLEASFFADLRLRLGQRQQRQRHHAADRSAGFAEQSQRTQTYTYDALNRLASVAEDSAWSRTYGYDRYGSRAITANVNGGLSAATPNSTSAYTASTNRLTSSWAEYDAAGNIEHFKFPGQSSLDWTAFYDAENKQRFFCAGDSAKRGRSPVRGVI